MNAMGNLGAIGFSVCALLLVSACTGQTPASSSQATADEARGTGALQTLVGSIDPALSREPSGDATDGSYLALVIDATATPEPRVTIDLLTDRRGRSNASNTANDVRHLQVVSIADAVVVLPGPGSTYSAVAPADFGRRYQAEPSARDTAYYVKLVNGKATAIWPVNFPRSIPSSVVEPRASLADPLSDRLKRAHGRRSCQTRSTPWSHIADCSELQGRVHLGLRVRLSRWGWSDDVRARA